MILKNAENNDFDKLKLMYEEAFPLIERKPYSVIEKNRQRGKTDVLAIKDDDIKGLVVTINNKDLVLVDFLAIDKNLRGSGIGSQAIELIREKYNDRRVFLEIEKPLKEADNYDQRLKRKHFYLKNGLKDEGVTANIYDTEIELLTFDKPVSFEEYAELYETAMDEKWLKKLGRPLKI